MPFSISQMLGGFRKKETSAKRRERAPHNTAPGKKSDFPGKPDFKEVAAKETSSAAPQVSKQKVHTSDLAWSLIVRPHISEKSTMLGEGKYILKVSRGASKGNLKRAVGDRYGVEVEDVKILNMPSKQRRRGATLGTKPGFKKAIITLAKGQLINEF
ncbi:MAG: 50S ribosomal protein L23 [bacterium]|nr:50S ribosomal protein L23 [bacterium]